ncbi:MAG: PIN domain-containing protein [Candidatus Aenigmarchaeota archaeon]|nr:PIN domain-containing protein [Candidatus Aenigmarchaeota archaeon]
MKYTSDSWFFIKLVEKDPKAIALWEDIKYGKARLIVPSVVITEIVKKYLMRGLNKELDMFISGLNSSENIFVADLTREIAEEAGKLSYSFNIPTIDSIVVATAVSTGYTNIISDDSDYKIAEKQNKIKRIRW